MSIASVSLDDKYRLERGTVFLTGMQALARLPMLQHELDRRAGLHTAGYVYGRIAKPNMAGANKANMDVFCPTRINCMADAVYRHLYDCGLGRQSYSCQ